MLENFSCDIIIGINNRAQKGKFEPNWLGPNIVTDAFGSGAYHLSIPTRENLYDPIKLLHLKKFYA